MIPGAAAARLDAGNTMILPLPAGDSAEAGKGFDRARSEE
jgi:hypothetical protein